MFQTEIVEKGQSFKIQKYIFRNSCRSSNNVEKDGRAGQAVWRCNTAHALYTPSSYGKNRDPHIICNTYCSPTARVVTQMRLSVTL